MEQILTVLNYISYLQKKTCIVWIAFMNSNGLHGTFIWTVLKYIYVIHSCVTWNIHIYEECYVCNTDIYIVYYNIILVWYLNNVGLHNYDTSYTVLNGINNLHYFFFFFFHEQSLDLHRYRHCVKFNNVVLDTVQGMGSWSLIYVKRFSFIVKLFSVGIFTRSNRNGPEVFIQTELYYRDYWCHKLHVHGYFLSRDNGHDYHGHISSTHVQKYNV